LNSDIFEYCGFDDQFGDDVLIYPTPVQNQNHFIEEYDPEDVYEIEEHQEL